jgi:hypothetical protein
MINRVLVPFITNVDAVTERFAGAASLSSSSAYVEALLAADGQNTILTGHFDDNGAWPATVRVLAPSLEDVTRSGNRSTSPPSHDAADPLAMACYAGISVQHVRTVMPAQQLVDELIAHLR